MDHDYACMAQVSGKEALAQGGCWLSIDLSTTQAQGLPLLGHTCSHCDAKCCHCNSQCNSSFRGHVHLFGWLCCQCSHQQVNHTVRAKLVLTRSAWSSFSRSSLMISGVSLGRYWSALKENSLALRGTSSTGKQEAITTLSQLFLPSQLFSASSFFISQLFIAPSNLLTAVLILILILNAFRCQCA